MLRTGRAPRAALLATALVATALVTTACNQRESGWRRSAVESASSAGRGDTVARVRVIEGFRTPESVRWDSARGVWWVSNIDGDPTAKDGKGFISRLRPDGTMDSLHFVMSGRGGVVLNAPKGMALAGDTLWVTDIDAVRAFDARNGRPLASVDLRGQQVKFLNDVARGGDGAIYVTEMASPDRIFRIAGRRVTTALQDDALTGPNGIAWDAANGRFVVGTFRGHAVLAWTPGGGAPRVLATGAGQYDGVEVLPDGRILASSWADSTVGVVDGAEVRPLVRGVPSPADIGVDPASGRLMIPLLTKNRVEMWTISRP